MAVCAAQFSSAVLKSRPRHDPLCARHPLFEHCVGHVRPQILLLDVRGTAAGDGCVRDAVVERPAAQRIPQRRLFPADFGTAVGQGGRARRLHAPAALLRAALREDLAAAGRSRLLHRVRFRRRWQRAALVAAGRHRGQILPG